MNKPLESSSSKPCHNSLSLLCKATQQFFHSISTMYVNKCPSLSSWYLRKVLLLYME
uniref:Uncharacterized protein n=1 Tax=Nelumbo nucifera TaxID=4432 RepID=A0A822XLU2_NELNU|nr:TPA_asm: hypothetical protein HUJ06_021634 [Nelumbo nucifera]DAD20174.1 TPA_asm: hypothetical protein HUJ06_021637 [Nelumbo nucifera]